MDFADASTEKSTVKRRFGWDEKRSSRPASPVQSGRHHHFPAGGTPAALPPVGSEPASSAHQQSVRLSGRLLFSLKKPRIDFDAQAANQADDEQREEQAEDVLRATAARWFHFQSHPGGCLCALWRKCTFAMNRPRPATSLTEGALPRERSILIIFIISSCAEKASALPCAASQPATLIARHRPVLIS